MDIREHGLRSRNLQTQSLERGVSCHIGGTSWKEGQYGRSRVSWGKLVGDDGKEVTEGEFS